MNQKAELLVEDYRSEMTFFSRFEQDILAGKKTITIRDSSERNFLVGSTVEVSTLEEGRIFTNLKVLAVTEVRFSELTEFHPSPWPYPIPTLEYTASEPVSQIA